MKDLDYDKMIKRMREDELAERVARRQVDGLTKLLIAGVTIALGLIALGVVILNV